MRELDSEVFTLRNLPDSGLKEGPYMFERNGLYYLTYPHVEHKTERLEYAVSDNPLGPFKFTGVIMNETPGCWTNHHSVIQYRDQWYLFYHANDYSPGFDKARSARIDSLFFRPDGTIQPVIPSLRGVGITKAGNEIQMDRYSEKSAEGIAIDFIDTTNRFMGWKTVFLKAGAWIRYNNTATRIGKNQTIIAKVKSAEGGILELRTDGPQGPVIAEWEIPKNENWQLCKAKITGITKGIVHLVVRSKSDQAVELDWVRFE